MPSLFDGMRPMHQFDQICHATYCCAMVERPNPRRPTSLTTAPVREARLHCYQAAE